MSRFDFRGAGLPDTVFVAALRGTEAISTLYRFEIYLVLGEAACASLDLDQLIGEQGTLELRERPEAEQAHAYHGVVSEAEVVHAARGMALLRLELVPELYRLTQSEHSRVFTDQAVGDIIKRVLDDAGVTAPYELQLRGAHPVEEHVCQYRESDLAFVSRWMEREGIFFTFVHGDSGPEKLVIADDRSSTIRLAAGTVRYVATAGSDSSAGVALRTFRPTDSALPSAIQIRGYDHARPALDVSGEEPVAEEGGQQVRHEERCFDPRDAQRLAKLRAEMLLCGQRRLSATGTVFGLRPGTTFSLEDHPRGALNQGYLVVAVEHRGSQAHELLDLVDLDLPAGYEISVELVPEAIPYRPPLRTPWPRIRGYQLAVVDGPADSDYAQLDEQGRYRVKLKFDESDLAGDDASTRVRMMQPHAGSPEGWHFPLRKGTEVVIQFLGGDPDRPVIAGAVPNAHNPSVVTSAHATQNVLQTGGRTRLEVEDAKDQQFVWIHTPPADTFLNLGYPEHASHHITLHSDKDCLYQIGSNQRIEVGGHLDEQVTGDVSESYSSDQSSTIHGPQSTTVTKPVKETYLSSQTTHVQQSPREEQFQTGQTTLVLGARQETYTGGQAQQVFGGTTETWVGGWTRTVTGNTLEQHDGSLTEMVAGAVTEICPTSVKETYGATSAVWASLTWISPGVEIKAPSCQLAAPVRFKMVVGSWDCTKWTENDSKPWDSGTTGIKVEVTGMSTAATGAKAEACGLALSIVGGAVETGVANIKVSGVYIGPVTLETN